MYVARKEGGWKGEAGGEGRDRCFGGLGEGAKEEKVVEEFIHKLITSECAE